MLLNYWALTLSEIKKIAKAINQLRETTVIERLCVVGRLCKYDITMECDYSSMSRFL